MKYIECPKCRGTGTIPDPKTTGTELRNKRRKARVSLTAVADCIGFSTSYVCELEQGRRHWSKVLITEYLKAIEFLNQKKQSTHYGKKTIGDPGN